MTVLGETGSLAGFRVHVLRGGDWGDGVAAGIRARGGTPVITELLRIRPAPDSETLRSAASEWNLGRYDWLLMTSANAVAAFVAAGGRPRAGGRVAAVGPATADALEQQGFEVDVVPDSRFSAVGLAESLRARLASLGERGDSLLLPVSDLADSTLEGALQADGHRVERITAYQTVSAAPESDPFGVTPISDGEARDTAPGPALRDAILVTSASAARAIAEHLTPLPPGTIIAAIGDPTATALGAAGLPVDVVAATHTVPGLLDALENLISGFSASPPGNGDDPDPDPDPDRDPDPDPDPDPDADADPEPEPDSTDRTDRTSLRTAQPEGPHV